MKTDKNMAVELINRAIPYSNQIKNWQLDIEDDAIRFEWRENKLRLGLQSLSVEEVGNGVLIGSDLSILLSRIIKIESIKMELDDI